MLSLCLAALLTHSPNDLVINDGDRIVLVGGALIEREQQFGRVEATLHMMYPDKKFTVRNLGWSGDTVWGEARAGFGTQKDGYKKLVEQVKAEKPTVLILGYGVNEAFAGKAGVEKFAKQYRQLLNDIAGEKTRCVFLSVPLSNVNGRTNPALAITEYDDAIKSIAREKHGVFVFINQLYYSHDDSRPRSDDGILPNEIGYQELSRKLGHAIAGDQDFRVKSGNWEPLLQLIHKKNELYFHQYRPQNDTYLFLFRKHEQGNNAAEIPKFTPLIEELDKQINEMKGKK